MDGISIVGVALCLSQAVTHPAVDGTAARPPALLEPPMENENRASIVPTRERFQGVLSLQRSDKTSLLPSTPPFRSMGILSPRSALEVPCTQLSYKGNQSSSLPWKVVPTQVFTRASRDRAETNCLPAPRKQARTFVDDDATRCGSISSLTPHPPPPPPLPPPPSRTPPTLPPRRRRHPYHGTLFAFCRREAVDVALHKLKLEDVLKEKKTSFVESLQAGLNEGGGYRRTPLVKTDFDPEHVEMLEGLEVRERARRSLR